MINSKAIQKCFGCGFCMYGCPAYTVFEAEIYSAKGKINALEAVEQGIISLEDTSDIFKYCNVCGHCMKGCPGGINIPDIVVNLRSFLNKTKPDPSFENILRGIKLGSSPEEEDIKVENGSDTLLFLGCTAKNWTFHIVDSILDFLDVLNFDYTIVDEEPCCGGVLHTLGYPNDMEEIAKKNITFFNKFDKIITICPRCYNTFTNVYKNITDKKFQVFHILHVINEVREGLEFNANDPSYFQIPCSLYNKDDRFKEIVPNIIGSNAMSSIDLVGATQCCGAGGLMTTIAGEDYVKKRVNGILEKVSAEKIVTACPGCYLNFSNNSSKKVTFITEELTVQSPKTFDLKHLPPCEDEEKIIAKKIATKLIKFKLSIFKNKLMGRNG